MNGVIEGRDVHYVQLIGEHLVHRAATICYVPVLDRPIVNLYVLPLAADQKPFVAEGVRFSEKAKDNTWHWIEWAGDARSKRKEARDAEAR